MENETMVENQAEQVLDTTPEANHENHAENQAPEQNISDQEKNFAALRKAKEAAEKERDEYVRRLKEIEANSMRTTEAKQEEKISDDDFLEGRHLRQFEEKLKKYEQNVKQTTTELQLKARYPDFDTVVNKDNIEKLRQNYPEIAATIGQSQDMYSKAISAYTLIKKLEIDSDGKFQSQRELVDSNARKPRPLNSVSPQQGNSPLEHANAFANGLTPDLKKKLYKEMMDLRKSS